MPVLEESADKVATDEAAGSGDKYRFIHGVSQERRCTTRGGFENGNPGKTRHLPGKINQELACRFLVGKSLTATSHPQANNRHQHVHGVANQVNFASRDIKPIDGKLNDPGPGLGERDEKFDIEGEALLVKTILDGFIAPAAHKFETTLRIVDRDAGYEPRMWQRRPPDGGAKIADGGRGSCSENKQIRSAFAVQTTNNRTTSCGGSSRRHRVVQATQILPQTPTRIDCRALPLVSRESVKIDVRSAALNALEHSARVRLP
jgi:hypothetical protein